MVVAVVAAYAYEMRAMKTSYSIQGLYTLSECKRKSETLLLHAVKREVDKKSGPI